MEIIVKEVLDPSEGQQAISQDGRLCIFHRGKWITEEEYDRGVYIKLADQGDCVQELQMDKAPNPSPWGIIIFIGIFAFLIWFGPVEERFPHYGIQNGTIDCNQDPATLSNIQLELCIDIQSFRKGSDYE